MDWSPRYLYRDLISDKDEFDGFMNDVFRRDAIRELDGYSPIHDGLAALAKIPPEHADLILAFTEHWAKMIGGKIESSIAVLKDVKATCLTQVWAMDITGITKARGFVSLTAVIDWFTCWVLSWRSRWKWSFALKPLEMRLPDMANRIF